jgi:hypothetical protein
METSHSTAKLSTPINSSRDWMGKLLYIPTAQTPIADPLISMVTSRAISMMFIIYPTNLVTGIPNVQLTPYDVIPSS